ncbi:ATP-grasp domain-containing protein [Tundrisphaera lichenicola]|uniref:ATP-grasp domain-containing protein n=1 Tax=Tundrisphaera lichenicola TaxID=2029860 RepID=UPI003EBDC8A1
MILGASARSAAYSAIRIGLQPTCADLFADLDLGSACPVHQIEPEQYPDGISRFADTVEPTPWLYTGAVENRPDLVDRISARHPLLGNPGAILRTVRDPVALSLAIRRAGLDSPEIRLEPNGLPTDGSWLVKPIASGGGRGIRPWLGGAFSRGRVYFQERMQGVPLAALYVGEGGHSRFLGLTRQFVGRPGNLFAYRGSLGPWTVGPEAESRIEDLGRVVASTFGLVGLFGIDLNWEGNRAWAIELNPRYTASVEVLEWAMGTSLLAEHLRAFRQRIGDVCPIRPRGYVGKLIVHADRPILRTPSMEASIPEPDEFPELADIPRPASMFRPGDPVLTVFARGDTPELCRRELGAMVRAWRRRLRPGC